MKEDNTLVEIIDTLRSTIEWDFGVDIDKALSEQINKLAGMIQHRSDTGLVEEDDKVDNEWEDEGWRVEEPFSLFDDPTDE